MTARDHTALITGAAGFIGSAVAGALADRGYEVHALVRPSTGPWRLDALRGRIRIHPVDLADRESLSAAVSTIRPGVLFHLAAEGLSRARRNQWAIAPANYAAAANLLEAAENLAYRRLVHVGGASEYGCQEAPIGEDAPLLPVTLYGASKAAATLLMQYAARSCSKPITVLRPFSVYGPAEPAGRLVPSAILAALRGTEIPLTGPGIRRDFVYVGDVAEACVLAAAADLPPGSTLNIGGGVEYSNEEVVACILSAAGAGVPVRAGAYPPRPWDCAHSAARISRARDLLGWAPRHSLEQGIAAAVDWFRLHQGRYS